MLSHDILICVYRQRFAMGHGGYGYGESSIAGPSRLLACFALAAQGAYRKLTLFCWHALQMEEFIKYRTPEEQLQLLAQVLSSKELVESLERECGRDKLEAGNIVQCSAVLTSVVLYCYVRHILQNCFGLVGCTR